MWILSSLSRPDRIMKVVHSYPWGDESRVMLTLWSRDKRLQEYLDQQWPADWSIEIVDCRGNGPTYNEMLRRYPNEPQYGFLADDAILDVPGMLRQLEEAAGAWNIAYPNDERWRESNCTMPCIGGELVRSVGYLSPPGFMHWAIDNAWHAIGTKLGCLRYLPHLTYTHLHPLNNSAPDDDTYRSAMLLSVGYDQILRAWANGEGLAAVVRQAQDRRTI